MTNKKKILIGGLGGITPVLMNLLVIDLEMLLIKFTIIALTGYLIRVVILFYLGGIVAFFNKGESDPVRVFQLGIVAPALLTAFINGTNIEVPNIPDTITETPGITRTIENPSGKMDIQIISSAFAQTETADKIKRFTAPQESAVQQLLRGLIGSKPKKLWFVIAGSYLKKEDAVKQSEQIGSKGLKAKVYEPYETNTHYSVVIGEHLTYGEAVKVRQKAIGYGLPKDVYLWTFEQ